MSAEDYINSAPESDFPELKKEKEVVVRIKVNDMFHIEDGKLVKTSNGQPIPADEPVFILRGRDHLAVMTLIKYLTACIDDHCDEERIVQLIDVIQQFRGFALSHKERMKQPGITKGA